MAAYRFEASREQNRCQSKYPTLSLQYEEICFLKYPPVPVHYRHIRDSLSDWHSSQDVVCI
jgi:hypothetical protein